MTRTVNVTDVPDTTVPVITLIGANPQTVSVGTIFEDPGATVTDDFDVERTISGTGRVDTAVAGIYTLTYDAKDVANNAATSVSRTVIVKDITAPVVTLFGANPLAVAAGGRFTDPGALVKDNVDEERTILGEGTVNTAVAGSYTITYITSDRAGNKAIPVTRTVNVGIPASDSFFTTTGGSLDLSKYFQEGAFASATVAVDGKLPDGLRFDPNTKRLMGYPRLVPSKATFNITLPGKQPQKFVMDFRFQPLPPALIGVHAVQTAAGDSLTIQVNGNASAVASVRKAGASRAVNATGTVSFDGDAVDPSQAWTIKFPSQKALKVALPVKRTLYGYEGSVLGNYGFFESKLLWGFKSTDRLGEITLKNRQQSVIKISGIVAKGEVTWQITPSNGERVSAKGLVSVDGICNLAVNVPGLGSVVGMLRVDEEIGVDGLPTGQLVMTILKGFNDWTPVQYVAP